MGEQDLGYSVGGGDELLKVSMGEAGDVDVEVTVLEVCYMRSSAAILSE
jgi:hypothetical protein